MGNGHAWILLTLGHVPGLGLVLTGRGSSPRSPAARIHSTRQLSTLPSTTQTRQQRRASPFQLALFLVRAIFAGRLATIRHQTPFTGQRGAATAARKSEHHRQKAAAAHSATPPRSFVKDARSANTHFPIASHPAPHAIPAALPSACPKIPPCFSQKHNHNTATLPDFSAITAPVLSSQVARHG